MRSIRPLVCVQPWWRCHVLASVPHAPMISPAAGHSAHRAAAAAGRGRRALARRIEDLVLVPLAAGEVPGRVVDDAVSTGAVPRWPSSRRPRVLLLHTRRLEPARIASGTGPVALTDQALAAQSSTSAVTVQVAKRSTLGPDTAGASGSGLAPPPGAARSILQVRLGGLPAEDRHARTAAYHQRLVERSQEGDATTCILPVGPLAAVGRPAVASGGPGQTLSTTAGRTSGGAWRQPRMKSRRSSSPWNVAPRREATCSTTPRRGRRSSSSSAAAGIQTRTRKVCMRIWCARALAWP